MSTSSVLIAQPDSKSDLIDAPRYNLLRTNDSDDIRSVQRLRYDVFSTEPGFGLFSSDRIDADRFDEYCDHLIVQEEQSGDFVGCYRMLPPPGGIAAGGLYTATEFDISSLDPIRPSLVEMGRAVVRKDHRNGAVVLMMWTGILAYLDHSGYDYAMGCVSVPICDGDQPGSQIRGVRDFVRNRHRAPRDMTVYPYRPVELNGLTLDEIEPPARPAVPPLMRGYLRLGARVCGEPAYDPEFAVGDFPALLDKRTADIRYLDRLRSAAGSS